MEGQTNNLVYIQDASSLAASSTVAGTVNEDEDSSLLLSPKRTIVLGVVDTTGMKSSVANRKRRWDQPPTSEEEEDTPPRKVFVHEEEQAIVEEHSGEDEEKVHANCSDPPHEPVKKAKPDVGVVTLVSDSLKRIQLVYDGEDSTDDDEPETSGAVVGTKDVESTESSDDLIMKACFQIESEGSGGKEVNRADGVIVTENVDVVEESVNSEVHKNGKGEVSAIVDALCNEGKISQNNVKIVEGSSVNEMLHKSPILEDTGKVDEVANGIDEPEVISKSSGDAQARKFQEPLNNQKSDSPAMSTNVTAITPSQQEVTEALRQRTLSTEMELEFDGDSAKTGYFEAGLGAKKPEENATDESFSLETFIGKGEVQTESALDAMVQELNQCGNASSENGGIVESPTVGMPTQNYSKLTGQTLLSDHSESTSMSLDTFVNSKADKMFTGPEKVADFKETVGEGKLEGEPVGEALDSGKPNPEIENQADSLASSDTVVISTGSPDPALSDDSNLELGVPKEQTDSGNSKLMEALCGKMNVGATSPGPCEISSAVKINEREIGNAEVVMVDPTKPLVEEDSLSEKLRRDTSTELPVEQPKLLKAAEASHSHLEKPSEVVESTQIQSKMNFTGKSDLPESYVEAPSPVVPKATETPVAPVMETPPRVPSPPIVANYEESSKKKEEIPPAKERKPHVLQPGKEIEPPKLSPITLRIFKDNLTIKTELDSPKKGSPLSSELRCSSPSTHSPSSQVKQLEFTLKIARDANTPYPKATMSPKNTSKPSPPIGGGSSPIIWKSEVPSLQVSQPPTEMGVQTSLDDLKVQSPQITDILKKVLLEGGQSGQRPPSTPVLQQATPLLATGHPGVPAAAVLPPMPEVPVKKKRGRPRKIRPLEDGTIPQAAPSPVAMPQVASPPNFGVDDGSHRPVRTCRGRTRPIVTRTRRPRGAGRGGLSRGAMAMARAASLLSMEESAESVGYGPMDADGSPVKIGVLPMIVHSGRGRGAHKQPTPDRETLSAREKAEIERIEERREKMRLEKIAKLEEKKAKKLAKKMKDEERRKRLARERAEKAEAGAPQVFEEETRMSAPDSNSRGHTPAPNKYTGEIGVGDESQNSISVTVSGTGNKKGRMEISLNDLDCLVNEVKVDDLAEYQWQGSELYMIQEQVSLYLGVKSFKRKYPHLKRRTVEAEERQYLEDSGLVPKSMCDLGLTAVSSAEILDIMFQDFPDRYEEFRRHCREKQAREAAFKQKGALPVPRKEGRVEPREQALEAVAAWNANLNRERRDERRCALDLQTFTIHYPKHQRDQMTRPLNKVGLYPLAVVPGQYCDYYKTYTPTEMMYFPLNTVLYGPLKPNERQIENASDDGSGSESEDSSSSSGDSSDSSSSSDSEDYDDSSKCQSCDGTKKNNKSSEHEDLIQCSGCKLTVHPSCNSLTPEMIPHLLKYDWCCLNCKICSKCNVDSKEKLMLSCNLCDRGYHLFCIGLKKMPEGRWHCSVCAYCSSCGSRSPGGSDWQHEFKKGEKGAKIYQRTLCTPCFKLWRKGKYCQICYKCHGMKPEEEGLMQCNTCERWIHRECFNARYGSQPHRANGNGFQCDLCLERIQSALSSHGIPRALIKV